MSMVSMNVEREDYAQPMAPNYCPCIYLTEEQVEALGLKDNPPPAGGNVGIRAIARVVSKTEDADLDGDGDGIDVRLTLEITEMEVTRGSMPSAAAALYGG
jgi:hypothetical protein